MDTFKKHFETALAMGENFVDRNPSFCQTSENRPQKISVSMLHLSAHSLLKNRASSVEGGKVCRSLMHELIFLDDLGVLLLAYPLV